MGLTQGAVFRHFPDKQAIWLAVFAWVRESLGAAIAAAMDRGLAFDLSDGLAAVFPLGMACFRFVVVFLL